MKSKTCLLTGVAIWLSLSAGTEKSNLTEGFRPGDLAPDITPENSRRAVDFTRRTGQYTLVNFWAAYDAVSRVRNMQFAQKTSGLDSTRITLFSVSMDEKESVFTETLKTDRLDATNQWYAGAQRSSLYKKYGLKNGLKNFLIDDSGVIVATNITVEQLSQW
ncbi:MAG: thioredoxin family protein [Tannerella sp.]|jgi:hypothetical protein|nr:thioredoxin family protein [Tannerella sp.]